METWKPNLARNQSWSQEDQKRMMMEGALKEDVKKWDGGGGYYTEGVGGFTEKRS